MLREWLKYSYGVFEEVGGFVGDPVYPAEYRYGGQTVPTRGCEGEEVSRRLVIRRPASTAAQPHTYLAPWHNVLSRCFDVVNV